ncbi:flavin-containing monooxygenase [Agromyces sp. NPDC058110]|uniref:flavin-containing monooxygenase n=1 Tax=Agromyces sp. NPDC058110 TaxID=3346345 RepID=UPI0036DA49ED
MSADVDVLVVGAGQAGLAVSHELSERGVEHVVLERDRVGSTWAGRWDSFRLVTPNHGIRMPGGAYSGDDPCGYLPRDGIVDHLTAYASSFRAPVAERHGVDRLEPDEAGFVARSAMGDIRARRVVGCTGAYQRPHRPGFVDGLAREVPVVMSADYRSPGALPDGPVLVIGGGQSACQIAEELHAAGRQVTLAPGRAPSMPRRIADRDGFDWLEDAGFFEQLLADQPSPAVRLAANPLATGAGGGHDLSLRTLAARGVGLVGRVVGVDDGSLVVADDLDESLAAGDAGFRMVCGLARKAAAARGLPDPDPPEPLDDPVAAAEVPSLRDLGAVVVACGYRPAYDWVEVPGVFDDMGFPVTDAGASRAVDGLWFVGVPWLRHRKSPLLMGVGEDAAIVAEQLA